MNALIKGGLGYFGSLLVDKLLAKKWNFRVLDLNTYRGNESVQYHKGDIRDYNDVRSSCANVDVVFHNVAQVPLAKDKKLFDSVNKLGIENILNASLESGFKKKY